MKTAVIIRRLRSLAPGRRWLALAIAVALTAGVATPLLAQTVTITQWTLPSPTQDIALDSADKVWVQTGGTTGFRRLDPVTNVLTTYTTGGVSHQTAITVDGADKVWSPGTISPITGTVQVISRLDPVTLELTSWPPGFQGSAVRVDSLGNGWTTAGSTDVARVEPGTNTVTTWTLPVNVSIGGFDASNRPLLNYRNVGTGEWGLARLDPVTNALTTWPAATNPDTVQLPFVDGAGNVWAALTRSVGEDSIIRLNPATDTITEWVCRSGCDLLVDVTVDAAGKVWFTQDLPNINRTSSIGSLDPADPPSFTEWAFSCDQLGATCIAAGTLPRSVVLDSAGNVWMRFSASASGTIPFRIARLTP